MPAGTPDTAMPGWAMPARSFVVAVAIPIDLPLSVCSPGSRSPTDRRPMRGRVLLTVPVLGSVRVGGIIRGHPAQGNDFTARAPTNLGGRGGPTPARSAGVADSWEQGKGPVARTGPPSSANERPYHDAPATASA